MLYPKMNDKRDVYSLNGVWEYCFVSEDYVPTKKNRGGKPMAVPASFNDIVTDMQEREYSGKVLYEKEFSVPKRADRLYRLRIGDASHKCEVYLNGEKIGERINGFYPVDLPLDNLKENNLLSVVIDNRLTAQTFPNGRIKNGKQYIKHDFFNFTGIHRDVLVYTLPKKHIDDIIIRTVVDGDYEKVAVELRGEYENACFRVFDEEGEEVVCSTENVFTIKNPRLWEVMNAYLYTLVVETDTDKYEERFGIRKVDLKNNRFLVNDKPVYFKGFGLHEDFFLLGRGNHPAVSLRNFECMKWANANSFRTSHYPYSEEMLDLADRYGFLVIDEAPAAGMVLWEECFGENAAFFKRLEPFARKANVKIALENLWNWDNEKDCAKIVACSGHEDFRRHLDLLPADVFVGCVDTSHAGMKGLETSAVQIIDALGERLGAMHLSDSDYRFDQHWLPFTMGYNFEDILAALKRNGYRGDITFEADKFVNRFPLELLPALARQMAAIGHYFKNRLEE